MRELRIIVVTGDAERFRGALAIAAAQAAMGGKANLFLQLDAVALLRLPLMAPRDAAHMADGLPSLDMLVEDALALGVGMFACQTGLALAGVSAGDLPEGVEVGGPIAFLQQTDDGARLVVV